MGVYPATSQGTSASFDPITKSNGALQHRPQSGHHLTVAARAKANAARQAQYFDYLWEEGSQTQKV